MCNKAMSLQFLIAFASFSISAVGADLHPRTVSSNPAGAEVSTGGLYRIGPGDILQISVWKEPDLSVPAIQVRPDGRISVPLLGDVPAAGLGTKELQGSLKAQLAAIVPGADVFVLVKEVRSERAFVIGAVKKEGAVLLMAPMTVLQILAEAGGLTEYAKPGKIQVLRTVAGKQVLLPFDYNAVIRGQNIQQNVVVLPGDTVVIPR
jgi:polysaccharide export outer membrane protein